MKRRLFLPLHLFILFATLLAAGCWCPRADAHEPEKGAFRHAPTQYETVIQDIYQPLLIQTEVRVPHVRGHELSQKDNDAPVHDAGQSAAPPMLPPLLSAGLPAVVPLPLRPSWRGLVVFPLPPPAMTAFPHMTPSGNRAKDTPTLGPCRARAAKRTESSVLPASGHPETRARRTCSPKTGEVSPFVPAPAGGNHGSSQEAVV